MQKNIQNAVVAAAVVVLVLVLVVVVVIVVVGVVIKVKSVLFVNFYALERKTNYKTRKSTLFYSCGAATRDFAITLVGHVTLYSTPLDGCSARRTDLHLTTHNTHKRQTSIPQAGFETTIPAGERPQVHALDRAATGIGSTNT